MKCRSLVISMLHPQAAEALIFSQVQPFTADRHTEIIPLRNCRDRILATPIVAKLDFPHWDNSAMDGYAVRFEDIQVPPTGLEVIEEIPAGKPPQRVLQSGQAARILTGSMMPLGADTVVMQEDTHRDGSQVTILTSPQPQQFVRKQGAYYQAGQPLLAAGTRLTAPEIAVLAAAQYSEVPVLRRPQVAILSTGSELIEPGQPLQLGQIVDSNQYALATLVEQIGAVPIAMGIVPDQPAQLKAAMQQALTTADMVISSGGVSVGDYDYIDRLLAELDASIHIRQVAIKPGKPLTVATQGEKLYFGLPGNPASALVTFWRFVAPAIRRLAGLSSDCRPMYLSAITAQKLSATGQRETYIWGQISLNQGHYTFHSAPGSLLSGNLINLIGINALAMLSIGQIEIMSGAPVQVLMLQP